jgi:transposase
MVGLAEDSNEYDIKLVCVKHRRKRMVRTCDCTEPKFITAPKLPQLIPKGKFSHAILSYVILMKYYFQVPLHCLLGMLWMRGLPVTESNIVGNFHTMHDLLTPLYKRLLQINQKADHWHVDETGWKVFAHTEKK